MSLALSGYLAYPVGAAVVQWPCLWLTAESRLTLPSLGVKRTERVSEKHFCWAESLNHQLALHHELRRRVQEITIPPLVAPFLPTCLSLFTTPLRAKSERSSGIPTQCLPPLSCPAPVLN